MVIKLCYPCNPSRIQIHQDFVYECDSYRVDTIPREKNRKKFDDIMNGVGGVLQYTVPAGLDIPEDYIKNNICMCPDTVEGERCDCGKRQYIVLLFLNDGVHDGMPFLLRDCQAFVLNDKGKTIDKIYVD